MVNDIAVNYERAGNAGNRTAFVSMRYIIIAMFLSGLAVLYPRELQDFTGQTDRRTEPIA